MLLIIMDAIDVGPVADGPLRRKVGLLVFPQEIGNAAPAGDGRK
jgi:hypothetical protein